MMPNESDQVWNRRPGAVMEETLRLAMALAFSLVVFALVFAGGSDRLYWLSPGVIAAIIIWLIGPRLLRIASDAGWFGKVRLKDGRLYAGGRRNVVELDRPMTVEARFQRATLRRRFRLSSISPGFSRARRTSEKRIGMMTAVIRQGERTVVLAADAVGAQCGEVPDLNGLNLRRVSISSPPAPVTARLRLRDLVDLLRVLQTAAGYRTALSPVPNRPPEDPRRPVWPLWKIATGLFVVLLLWMSAAAGSFFFFMNERRERIDAEAAEAKREASIAEEMVRADYLEKRVTAPIRKWRVEGRVEDVAMVEKFRFEPEFVKFMGPMLVVAVDAIYDENDAPMPPDAEIYFHHVDDRVRVGDRVELDPEEIRLLKDESSP